MDCLQEDPILEFNPDTLSAVRKIYGLDGPGQMDQAIDVMEDWLSKQKHFTQTVFPREYLERIIIQVKGSVERAKLQLDKLCTLRTMIPRYFELTNPQEDLKEIRGYVHQALMPKMTTEHYRIFMWRINGEGPHTSSKIFMNFIYGLMVSDYVKAHDYCDGLILIWDLRDVPIAEFVAHINFTEMWQLTTIYMEGFDLRLKHIFYLTSSKTVNLLSNLMKQFLTSKMASRIQVVKTIEETYSYFPKDYLPEDYGGKEKSLEKLNDEFLEIISTPEKQKYWEEMKNARTDETKRSKCTFDESLLGTSGTFRTLNVD